MGRKKLPVDQVAKVHAIRLTPARINKLKELGGAKWLSKVLDDNMEMDKNR